MARRKKQEAETDVWAAYRAIQLPPEQKAAGRERMRERAQAAAATGVYEKLLALQGKVHLEYDIDELREDRD